MEQVFNLLDVNNDGMLTKLELSNLSDSIFAVSYPIAQAAVVAAGMHPDC